MIFSDHGDIGQACGAELRAAVQVQADLAKKTAELDSRKHKQQLTELRDKATEQAQEHMKRAVKGVRSIESCGRVPSAKDSERAAAVLVDRFYREELRRSLSDADRQTLNASYSHFTQYLESSAENLTSLGEALYLAQVCARRNGKLAHGLRTVAMLAAVRRAGGHRDRNRFKEEVHRIVPEWLQDPTSAETVRNLVSAVFLCFRKLLGDVPGAFRSNAQLEGHIRHGRKPQRNQGASATGKPEPSTYGRIAMHA